MEDNKLYYVKIVLKDDKTCVHYLKYDIDIQTMTVHFAHTHRRAEATEGTKKITETMLKMAEESYPAKELVNFKLCEVKRKC